MGCQGAKYIVKEIILPGEQGPQGIPGIQGPPGPPIDTIEASNVSVENEGYLSQQEINDFLLYDPIVINSFGGPDPLYELGRILTSLTFTWSLNKDVVSQTLVGPPEMTPVVLTPEQRSVTVTLTNLGTNATFTLTVDDGSQTPSSNFNLVFANKNYYGDALLPPSIDSAFVLSLNNLLKTNRSYSYTTNATGSQYNWYCVPERYGAPVMYANGLEGGFTIVQVLSFTNNYGYTENYNILRSDNPAIGPGVTINAQ